MIGVLAMDNYGQLLQKHSYSHAKTRHSQLETAILERKQQSHQPLNIVIFGNLFP
jgi:hypothetical protein